MLLHYNPKCGHNDAPTTPLRLLCSRQRYTEAMVEVVRLRALGLDPVQMFVLDAHSVIVRLRLGRMGYAEARSCLGRLSLTARGILGDELLADFKLMRIALAATKGDRALVAELQRTFFDSLPRTLVTEGMWRMAMGMIEVQPAEAIPHFDHVVASLVGGEEPCLQEMAARYMARSLCALGERQEAVTLLRRISIPASTAPQEGQVSLNELLILPMT